MCVTVLQVYNVRQAKMDIDAVYSMGLFDDVTILPQPADDSTLEHPKVRETFHEFKQQPTRVSRQWLD